MLAMAMSSFAKNIPSVVNRTLHFKTPEDLAAAMKRAADAHHVYETTRGVEDKDWPKWYAEYIAKEQGI